MTQANGVFGDLKTHLFEEGCPETGAQLSRRLWSNPLALDQEHPEGAYHPLILTPRSIRYVSTSPIVTKRRRKYLALGEDAGDYRDLHTELTEFQDRARIGKFRYGHLGELELINPLDVTTVGKIAPTYSTAGIWPTTLCSLNGNHNEPERLERALRRMLEHDDRKYLGIRVSESSD